MLSSQVSDMPYKDRQKQLRYWSDYQKKHPEKVKVRDLKRRYGISGIDYQKLVNNQNGKCAICKRTLPLNLDHNHETGQLRELLCRGCNWGIWSFGENVKRLKAAADYIQKWK